MPKLAIVNERDTTGANNQASNNQDELSLEMRQLLEEEALEAEIEAAMDAALEEGMVITREEAIKIIKESKAKEQTQEDLPHD